jgi:Fic family protein
VAVCHYVSESYYLWRKHKETNTLSQRSSLLNVPLRQSRIFLNQNLFCVKNLLTNIVIIIILKIMMATSTKTLNKQEHVGFVVLTVVATNSTIFLDVTHCILEEVY